MKKSRFFCTAAMEIVLTQKNVSKFIILQGESCLKFLQIETQQTLPSNNFLNVCKYDVTSRTLTYVIPLLLASDGSSKYYHVKGMNREASGGMAVIQTTLIQFN